MTDNQKLIGSRGSKVLTGTDPIENLKGYSIIVQEDTVITLFKVNDVDSTSAYGLTGTALKAGAYIVVPTNDIITDITMSSGSVIIYNQ